MSVVTGENEVETMNKDHYDAEFSAHPTNNEHSSVDRPSNDIIEMCHTTCAQTCVWTSVF
ncbi:hypothetical protein GCM10022627_35890 [Haloarcula argentinensis]|uniref:Uncharacterized protein n=1 Tax=Haloarcula argentinensis TaxID=43776 RepID=A0A830FWW3_HALAR|nr:hypothetical protein GCM10009006_35990 [Haloarcula argentinensis]